MEHHYKVDAPASIEEVYSEALSKSIEFMFLKLLRGHIIFDELVIFWSNLWKTAALRIGCEDKEIADRELQGLMVLLEVFDKLDSRLTVVGVNVPWSSKWEALNAEVVGEATAVLYGSFVEDTDYGRDFFVVETIPTHAPFRGNATAMQTYHLSSAAIAGSARFTYRQRGFGLVLVDLKTGVVTLKEPVSYMSMAPIIKNAMLQMVHKAGIPNTGSHCRRCPYKGVCSPSIWTEKKLRSRKKTSKQLTLELLDE